ncbi:MAG TPA: protein disulfide oxidoreductase [Burkholderiales bacterium]|nr:protein disulfide oxidoreductase [Burkholderiales bacterium]
MIDSKRRRLAEILIFVILIAGIRAWQQRDVPEGPAPFLGGTLLDGESYARPSEPVLVHFWATWCPICKTEEASIQHFSRNHRVVTIAMKSGENAEVSAFMKREKLDFPVLNDPEGGVSNRWGVHAVPASFFLDSKGRIRFVEFGYTTTFGLRLRFWLMSMIP